MKMSRTTTALYATVFLLCAHGIHAQTREKDLKAVLKAEKDFAKLSVDSSAQLAFDRYLSADAMLFRPRAVRAIEWRRTHPLSPLIALTWEPEFADMSRAGDLAYTSGPYVAGSRRSSADPTFGQFVTIWRKQTDGRWLATFNGSVLTPYDTLHPNGQKLITPPAPSPYLSRLSGLAERNSLLDADNNFANAVKQSTYADALKSTASPSMRLLRAKNPLVTGMKNIASETKGARMTMWMPLEAVVSASGDLGYTRGSYVASLPSGTNEPGDYLRVWRRDNNGKWQVALDMLSAGR